MEKDLREIKEHVEQKAKESLGEYFDEYEKLTELLGKTDEEPEVEIVLMSGEINAYLG